MNTLKAQIFFRIACCGLALLAVNGARAEDFQPSRFLLVFETSSAVKKNLPAIQQTLDQLFSSNLQNQMQENDDLAVWTVDDSLHTGTFPLASWSPDDAVTYSDHLKEFLGQQRFTRHASLAPLQPLLNRVAKNSEHLTVLIFCDSQSHLMGTPYDAGVNSIITNAATKGVSAPFILVLRANHGTYLGCSVNRSTPLNFPKFPPPPPKSEPPPPVVVAKPAPATPAVVVPPVPALIIVGTNAGTDPALLTKPAPAPVPPIPTAPPPTTGMALPATPPPTTPKPASAATTTPPAVMQQAPPAPAPVPAPQVTSTPAIIVPSNTVVAAAEEVQADSLMRWPIVVAVGLLVIAAGLIGWLIAHARRPRGSLITTSLQNDPNLPRRK